MLLLVSSRCVAASVVQTQLCAWARDGSVALSINGEKAPRSPPDGHPARVRPGRARGLGAQEGRWPLTGGRCHVHTAWF